MIRIFGDLHGNYDDYIRLAEEPEVTQSLQVGDMGYDYVPLSILDPAKHVFIGGNHDNYTLVETDKESKFTTKVGPWIHGFQEQFPHMSEKWVNPTKTTTCRFAAMSEHYLGNFGLYKLGNCDIFYVRGGWSIDGDYRRKAEFLSGKPYGWFPREQLSIAEGDDCLTLYEQIKPDVVISHCCPTSVIEHLVLRASGGVIYPNYTDFLLQLMFDVHRPKLWIFGHYHQYKDITINGTRFICLNSHKHKYWYADFDDNMNLIKKGY